MVGLGGTAEKLQKVASMAEDVYKRLNEMRQEMNAMRETVERIDKQTTDNRALLEAIAEKQDVNADTILAEAAIQEAEPAGGDTTAGTNSPADTATTTDDAGETTASESPASESTNEGSTGEGSTSTRSTNDTTDTDGETTDDRRS